MKRPLVVMLFAGALTAFAQTASATLDSVTPPAHEPTNSTVEETTDAQVN